MECKWRSMSVRGAEERIEGKEKVPMLQEIYPKQGAAMVYWFTVCGVIIAGIGLLFEENTLFKAGGSFLCMGAVFLVITMSQMLS